MSDSNMDPQLLVERTQDHLDHYINVADRKASILLTGHLAFLGLYANVVKFALTTPSKLAVSAISLTIISTLIAGGLALSVVYPRTPETSGGYMFWGSILDRSEDEYRAEMKEIDSQSAFDEFVDENYALAQVAAQKYRYFRYSLFATGVFVILALFSYVTIVI